MASKQAALVPVERSARDIADSAPVRVYIGADVTAGHYTFKTLASEATAYLKDDGTGSLTLDDDPAEDDRKPYLVSTSPNTIVL